MTPGTKTIRVKLSECTPGTKYIGRDGTNEYILTDMRDEGKPVVVNLRTGRHASGGSATELELRFGVWCVV